MQTITKPIVEGVGAGKKLYTTKIGKPAFDYFTKGSVPSEAWGILVVMIITNSYSWDYWKEISSKVWNEDGSVKD